MAIHYTDVVLDGTTCGIGAFIGPEKQWIKRSDCKSNLFTNLASLESKIFAKGYDYHDVNICFIVNDKITGKHTININEATKESNHVYKVARFETINGVRFLHVYNLIENTSVQVTSIGYIDTKASGTHDPNKDPKFEYAKLKHLRTITWDTATQMVTHQEYGLTCYKNKYGVDLKIANTTGVIHLWAIGKVMDYNTLVKKKREDGTQIRCLPFLNGKDKYGSLYMFATCDEIDYNDTAVRTRIEQLSEMYLSLLNELYPTEEINYSPCQVIGKVIVDFEITVEEEKKEE